MLDYKDIDKVRCNLTYCFPTSYKLTGTGMERIYGEYFIETQFNYAITNCETAPKLVGVIPAKK
jgi:hypothetical protein